MTKKTKTGAFITERDRRLFLYLFVNKVAAIADIMEDVFHATARKNVYRRLTKLAGEKLIETSFQREGIHRLLYSLTMKGFKKYVSDEAAARRVQLRSNSIEHDLTLLKIKRRLRTLDSVLAVYSENLVASGLMDDTAEVRRLKGLRSDAIVKIDVRGKNHFLPLEYEASSKSPRRNAQLVSKYLSNPFVPGVVFISKTDAVAERVRRKELSKNADRRGVFYHCLLEDVLDGDRKPSPTSITGDVLTIE